MPFFSVLRHFSNLSDARPASESPDVVRDLSSGNSDESSRRRRESEPTRTQPWTLRRKGASAIGRAMSFPPIEHTTFFKIRKAKNSAPNSPVREIPFPIPPPPCPGVISMDMPMALPGETIMTTSPVQDLFSATQDEVKDGPQGDSAGPSSNALGRLGIKVFLSVHGFIFIFR